MSLLFVIIALSIHIIFLFKREILFQKKSFVFLLVVSLIPLVFSFLIKNSDVKNKNVEMLQMPFITLLIFFIMNKIYKIIYAENAKDTFWTYDVKLMNDGIFNALFWFLGLIIPIIILCK